WARPRSSGPPGLRDCVGFMPNRPHCAAGMRMEPRPSEACAIGTMPLATAAAAPPDDPPVLWFGFHGLWQLPRKRPSVVPGIPNSGVLVLAASTMPAERYRFVSSASAFET